MSPGRRLRLTPDRHPEPPRPCAGRAIVLAPELLFVECIEPELVAERLVLQVARSVDDAVSALCDDPPPRAQILIVDFDRLKAPDVFKLHEIRVRGWFGAIIAIGRVPPELRQSLTIDHVLGRPLGTEDLVAAIHKIGVGRMTAKLPAIP